MSTPIRRALYGKLSGDTTLNGLLAAAPPGYNRSIYHQQGPERALYPFVVFSKSAGTPSDTFHEPGALESDIWLVKAVDKGNSADVAEAIAARLIMLLNDANLSIAGADHLYLRRESDVEYPEVTAGEVFHHVGSTYRLMYSPSP